MTSKIPSLGSMAPKAVSDLSAPKVTAVAATADAKMVDTDAKVWNTKNLGLRLAADAVSGFSAAALVAPVISVIDKAIMQNASGQASLKKSLISSFSTLLRQPQSIIFSTPYALICMLYGGTYLTANTLDTFTSTAQNKPASHVTAGTAKFAASSTANVGLCLIKDQAFAKLFGPGGPPRPVPFPSYFLFAARDCMTIFASFNIPPLLGPAINKSMGKELEKRLSGQTLAQFVAPASVQLISTPLHLLGLDLYNRPSGAGGNNITWGDRWTIIKKNWGISAVARMCRIMPAFGVGGVVNKKMRAGFMHRLE